MGKIGLTYREYGKLIDESMVELFKKDWDIVGVYGLPRGGLPLAVHISHHLNIPLILNLMKFSKDHPGKQMLVVDDIVDTGKTFERLVEFTDVQDIPFKSLTIYHKPDSTFRPDIIVKETTSWIVFPWEPYEEMPSEYHQNVYSDIFKGDVNANG